MTPQTAGPLMAGYTCVLRCSAGTFYPVSTKNLEHQLAATNRGAAATRVVCPMSSSGRWNLTASTRLSRLRSRSRGAFKRLFRQGRLRRRQGVELAGTCSSLAEAGGEDRRQAHSASKEGCVESSTLPLDDGGADVPRGKRRAVCVRALRSLSQRVETPPRGRTSLNDRVTRAAVA